MSIIDPPRSFIRGGYRYTVGGKAKPKWDENEHPRDRVGRFIETGAEVSMWGGQGGRVVRNVGGGRIEIVRADGSHAIVHRNYLTVTKRPDGSAPTAQQGENVTALPEQEPVDADAEEVDVPAGPAPQADTVRDQGAELADAVAEQVDDPDLVDEIRARTTAYHRAATNNVPDDEADERAALLATLATVGQRGGGDQDIADLSAEVHAAATAEPEAPAAPAADGPAAGPETGPVVVTADVSPDGAFARFRSSDGSTEAWLRTDENDQPVGYLRDNTVDPPRTVRYADATQWAADVDQRGLEETPDGEAEPEAAPTEQPQTPAGDLIGTIANPDDPTGSPAYDGPLDQVHTALPPGTYAALTDDGDSVEITVTENGSTVTPRAPAADQPEPPLSPSETAQGQASQSSGGEPSEGDVGDVNPPPVPDGYDPGTGATEASGRDRPAGTPQVVSVTEFESLASQDRRLYRGVSGTEGAARTRRGVLGGGDFGHGIYLAEHIALGQAYANNFPSGQGRVMRVALREDANIVDLPDNLYGSANIDAWAKREGIDGFRTAAAIVIRNPDVLIIDDHDYTTRESVILDYEREGYTIPDEYAPEAAAVAALRDGTSPEPEPEPDGEVPNGSIADPDDPAGTPAYDGPLDQAHTRLDPGTYDALTDDGDSVQVTVTEDSSTVTPVAEGETAPETPAAAEDETPSTESETPDEPEQPGDGPVAAPAEGRLVADGPDAPDTDQRPGSEPSELEAATATRATTYETHLADIETKLDAAIKAGQTTDALHTQDPDRQVWTPERAELHKQIVDDLYAAADGVPTNGKALIAGGLGGAGKSTALGNHADVDPGQYLTINPDDIKETMAARGGMIPDVDGLSPMEASPLVHEEASHIASLLAARAYADRRNVIWDITMSGTGSVQKRIAALRRHGYTDVQAVFVDIPVEVSVTRALARHRRGMELFDTGKGHGGRYVPPRIIRENASAEWSSANRAVFESLKDQFDTWSVYDNSVDGRAPQFVARSTPDSDTPQAVEQAAPNPEAPDTRATIEALPANGVARFVIDDENGRDELVGTIQLDDRGDQGVWVTGEARTDPDDPDNTYPFEARLDQVGSVEATTETVDRPEPSPTPEPVIVDTGGDAAIRADNVTAARGAELQRRGRGARSVSRVDTGVTTVGEDAEPRAMAAAVIEAVRTGETRYVIATRNGYVVEIAAGVNSHLRVEPDGSAWSVMRDYTDGDRVTRVPDTQVRDALNRFTNASAADDVDDVTPPPLPDDFDPVAGAQPTSGETVGGVVPPLASTRDAARYVVAQADTPDMETAVQAALSPTVRPVNGMTRGDGWNAIEQHPAADRLVPLVIAASAGIASVSRPGRGRWDGIAAQAALTRLADVDRTLPSASVGQRVRLDVMDPAALIRLGRPAVTRPVTGVVEEIHRGTAVGRVAVVIRDDAGERHTSEEFWADDTLTLDDATTDPEPPPPPPPAPGGRGRYTAVPEGTGPAPEAGQVPGPHGEALRVHPEGASLMMYNGDGIPEPVTAVGVRNDALTGWGQVVQHTDGSYDTYAPQILATREDFDRAWHVFDGQGRIVAGGPDISQQQADAVAERFTVSGLFGDRRRGPFRVAQGDGAVTDVDVSFADVAAGDLAAGDRIEVNGQIVSLVSVSAARGEVTIEYADADGGRGSIVADGTEQLRRVDGAGVKDDSEPPAPALPVASRDRQVRAADLASGDRVWLGNRTAVVDAVSPRDDSTVTVTVRWPDRTVQPTPFGVDAVLDRADAQFLPDPSPIDPEVPVARPVLYTYQRRNLVALGWDQHEDPLVAEAARRIRMRQPLAGAHAQALAAALVDAASQPGVRPVRQRSMLRLAGAVNAAAIQAGGGGVDIPPFDGSDRATRTALADFTPGDQIVFVDATGKPVTGRVTAARRMMSGRLFEVTYTGVDGNEQRVLLARDTRAYLLPDLPDPVPVEPDRPGQVREHVTTGRIRVGDTVHIPDSVGVDAGDFEVLEVSTEGDSDGRSSFRVERALRSGSDPDEYWVTTMSPTEPTVVRVARGPESQDQPQNAVMADENPTQVAFNEATIGDRIQIETVFGSVAVTGLVVGLATLTAQNEDGRRVDGRNITVRADDGARSTIAVFADDGQTVTRLVENDRNAVERIAAAQRLSEEFREVEALQEVFDRHGDRVMNDYLRDAEELFLHMGSDRDVLLGDSYVVRTIQTLLDRALSRRDHHVKSLSNALARRLTGKDGGPEYDRAARDLESFAAETSLDYLMRAHHTVTGASPTQPGESRGAAMLAAVREMRAGNMAPGRTRDTAAIARSVADLGRRLRTNEDTAGPARRTDVPALPEGADLRTRMDAYKDALPGTFGSREKAVRNYDLSGLKLDALERGELPEITEQTLMLPDLAVDGGPDEDTMRQLAVVRAAGRDLDDRMQQIVREIDPELPDRPDEVLADVERQRVEAYKRSRDTDKAYVVKRNELRAAAAAAAGFDPADPWEDLRRQVSEARRTAWGGRSRVEQERIDARAEVARLDALTEEFNATADKSPDLVEANRAWNEAREAYITLREHQADMSRRLAAARITAAHRTLSEVRDMGGAQLAYTNATGRKRGAALTERGEIVKAMRYAESNYPTAWLELAKARGAMRLAATSRGHYNPMMREIRLSKEAAGAPGVPARGRVATHELGHDMEVSVPGLLAAERALLWSRASTGDIGSRQLVQTARIDKQPVMGDEFPEPYTGKTYPGDSAYEVFTTAVESLLAGASYLDDDLRRWTLGVMALL